MAIILEQRNMFLDTVTHFFIKVEDTTIKKVTNGKNVPRLVMIENMLNIQFYFDMFRNVNVG